MPTRARVRDCEVEDEVGESRVQLLEAGDRSFNSLVGLEDFDQLCDGEEALNLVGDARHPQLAPLGLYGGHRSDECAEARAVDPFHLSEVKDDFCEPFLEQAVDFLAKFRRVGFTHEIAFEGENSDIAVHLFFDRHTKGLLKKFF